MMRKQQLKLSDIMGGLTREMGSAADKNSAFAAATQQSSRQLVQLQTSVKLLLNTFYEAGLGDFLAQLFRFLRASVEFIKPFSTLIGALLSPLAAILNQINNVVETMMKFLNWSGLTKFMGGTTRGASDFLMGRDVGSTVKDMGSSYGSTAGRYTGNTGGVTETSFSEFSEKNVNINLQFNDNELKNLIDVRSAGAVEDGMRNAKSNPSKRYGSGTKGG